MHVTVAETIAELAKEAGVKAFVHVSALSADLESESQWSQSKARGEIAVRNKFPEAVRFIVCVLLSHLTNWV